MVLVLPPSGLKFTFFPVPFSSMITFFFSFPSPTRAHVGVSARIGLAALWLAKTWNFLKKYLNCFFSFFLCIWSFSYPQTPLLLPAAMWRTPWQISGPHPSHSALRGPCCSPTCRRHPQRSPPRHTGNQKTSVANLQGGERKPSVWGHCGCDKAAFPSSAGRPDGVRAPMRLHHTHSWQPKSKAACLKTVKRFRQSELVLIPITLFNLNCFLMLLYFWYYWAVWCYTVFNLNT